MNEVTGLNFSQDGVSTSTPLSQPLIRMQLISNFIQYLFRILICLLPTVDIQSHHLKDN